MNEIKKTTLHPDNQPNVDLYPKTSADQVESLDARITALSTHIYKVSIDLPKGAQNGNITQSQLNILQASEFNCIEMINDKELYYLNDPGHEEGFLTYSHVGIENGKATIKTLTITVSAKSFVIVTTVVPTDAGGKLYRHDIYIEISADSGAPTTYNGIEMYGSFYSTSNTNKTIADFWEKNYLGIYSILHYKYDGNIAVPSNDYMVYSQTDKRIGLFELKNENSSYGYSASPTDVTTDPFLSIFNLIDSVTEI